jgi:uncharacterized protein (DUF362 family)
MPFVSQDSDRRSFLLDLLRLGGLAAGSVGVATWLSARSRRPAEGRTLTVDRASGVAPDPSLPEMVVAQGPNPRELVRRAIAELGGVNRFVARGDIVVVKPNIGWDRAPEQAVNTNPFVVAELVTLCLQAGARKVVVTDVCSNEARSCFERSGIGEAALSAGAEVILPAPRRFKEVNLRGEVLGVWPVLDPFLEADKVINVPIAKHHSLTGVTLGMKNWYGILGGQRSRLHQRIHESLVDLAAFMRPTLTVMDAYRILVRNGPNGGGAHDAEEKNTVIASLDPVAVDAYAAEAWWHLDSRRLRYLTLAEERGLGKTRFEDLRTKTLQVTE